MVDFSNEKPIYLQIVGQIQKKMIVGEYACDQRLPSVREMASEFKVNPNTMQRAFQELENQGLVYSVRTSGRYVTKNQSMIDQLKEETIKKEIHQFFLTMDSIGVDLDQIISYLKEEKGE